MLKAFTSDVVWHAIEVFRGRNIFFHIGAAAVTYVLVMGGFDWYFFEITRKEYLYGLVMTAGIGGFFVPVIVPLAMYVVGLVKKNTKLSSAAIAAAQAVIVAWCVSSFYKALTGRIQPEFITQASSLDISRDFNFGFLQNGIFWGWPSSHTAVACALAAALFVYYQNNAVRVPAFIFAAVVASGASIGFHWFSDVVAGVIIGTLVGIVVARNR